MLFFDYRKKTLLTQMLSVLFFTGICGCLLGSCRTSFGGSGIVDAGGDGSVGSCGNGRLETQEGCDDGNSDDGDGCSSLCEVEGGWLCEGEPSECQKTCGNGIKDLNEECDGKDFGGQTCDSLGQGFSGGDLFCTSNCLLDTFECVLPSCGDGVLDFGEECDLGDENSINGACLTNCRQAFCGDGFLQLGVEACDEGSENSDEQADACRTDCTEARCGDGVQDTGEGCDQGDGNSDVEADACRTDCTQARCGDGVIDTGEGCDDGQGNSDTEPGACSMSCKLPPPFWSYKFWRIDNPQDSGCGEWGKISEVKFRVAGSFVVNTATGYTTGTAGGQPIVAITHSGDSSHYGSAWQAFGGDGDPWQKYSGNSYYWLSGDFLMVQVSEAILTEEVRVGTFWGSANCMRLSGSNDGVNWDVLQTQCNGDCNSVLEFVP